MERTVALRRQHRYKWPTCMEANGKWVKAYRVQEPKAERHPAAKDQRKWKKMQMEAMRPCHNDKMISGSMKEIIKEIVEHHHVQMYFKRNTHATPACRLGESNKGHWGQMIDITVHMKHQWELGRITSIKKNSPLENNNTVALTRQPHENRGRRFENRRRNVGVEIGKCACGATAILQHIITECSRRRDKKEITKEAQAGSEKHKAQSQMPKMVKEVMSHEQAHTHGTAQKRKRKE
jgi:hypothetical protein